MVEPATLGIASLSIHLQTVSPLRCSLRHQMGLLRPPIVFQHSFLQPIPV